MAQLRLRLGATHRDGSMTEIGIAGTEAEIGLAGTEARTTTPSMSSTLTTTLRAHGSRARASSANTRNVSAITRQMPPMNTPAQKGAAAVVRAGVSERLSNPHGLNLAADPATGIVRPGAAKIPTCRPRPALREAKFGNRLPTRPPSLPARSAGGIRQRAPAKEMFLANGKKKDKGSAAINHAGRSDKDLKLLPSSSRRHNPIKFRRGNGARTLRP